MNNSKFTELGKTYLQSNACGLSDGSLKATTHRQLCELFVSERLGVSILIASMLSVDAESIASMVRKSTLPLTDYLDEVIDFPLDKAPNYKRLTTAFVGKFLQLATDWFDEQTHLMSDTELQGVIDRISHNRFSLAYPALESYGFEFADGEPEGENRFLTMKSKIGQLVTVTPNMYFGCKIVLDKGL